MLRKGQRAKDTKEEEVTEALFVVATVIFVVLLVGSAVFWEVYPYLWKRATGNHLGRRKYGHTYNEVKGLSDKAVSILVLNQKLPEAHRHGPELIDTLRMLDIRAGGRQKVNSHYCFHMERRDKCSLSDYHDIEHSINEISDALEEQKSRLAELAIQGVVVDTEILLSRAREEAEIIRGTTKELA